MSADTVHVDQAFKGMKGVLMSTVFSYHDSKGKNPLWPGIQYKGDFPSSWPSTAPLCRLMQRGYL